MALGQHLIPSRTQKLSLAAAMILVYGESSTVPFYELSVLNRSALFICANDTYNRLMFKVWRILLISLALIALPTSVIAVGIQSSNAGIDSAAQDNFGRQSADYRLVVAKNVAKATPGNMGSFVLPQQYNPEISNSIEINVLQTDLATYYPLDTNTGETTYDDSIEHKSARLINGTSWINGKLGSALAFDGKDDYVVAEFAPGLKSTPGTTWSAWIKPSNVDNVTQDQMILSMQGPNNLRLFGRKLFGSFKVNGQAQSVSGITALENNNWYHIASTYDGSSFKLYLNGSLEAELTNLTGAVELDTGQFEIGRWQASDPRYYQGQVDEVKLYTTALNAEQIRLGYTANLGGVNSAQPLFVVEPGASQTSGVEPKILSDASAFQFSLNEDNPLTQAGGSAYIPSISGTFSNPQEWSEGTTNGLGFSWINSDLGIWGKNPNYRYSAINDQASVLVSTNTSLLKKPTSINLQYRLDVNDQIPVAVYTNTIFYKGMLKP